MPNPLNLSDAQDLTQRSIQKIHLKNMPHLGNYTKSQLSLLKKKGIKPGTGSAHKMLSGRKAKEILRHGEVRGHALTPKQKRFFGARAGGLPIIKGQYGS